MPYPRRVLIVATIGMTLANVLSAQSSAFEHPTVVTVLEMVAEGQTDDEILVRADELAPFPEFDGRDLAELKRRGVSDRVLLRMLELTGDVNAAQQPSMSSPGAEPSPTSATPSSGGIIRVTVDCPFDVTYLEVVLDGEIKKTRGELWLGSLGAGENLGQPPGVTDEEPSVLFESTVPPGTHTTAVGFAVTTVKEHRGGTSEHEADERYETRGIRATSSFLPGQAPTGNRGASCDVKEGQLCQVLVTPQLTPSSELGGASVYDVHYQVSIVELQ